MAVDLFMTLNKYMYHQTANSPRDVFKVISMPILSILSYVQIISLHQLKNNTLKRFSIYVSKHTRMRNIHYPLLILLLYVNRVLHETMTY